MGVLTPSANIHPYYSRWCGQRWPSGQGPLRNHGILPYENRYRLGVPPYRGEITQFNEAMAKAFMERHECIGFNFSRQYPSLLFPGTDQYEEDSVPIRAHRRVDSIQHVVVPLCPARSEGTT